MYYKYMRWKKGAYVIVNQNIFTVPVRARTIGKANAERTSPDVKKAQISFSAEESPPSVYLFVISVGSGERK